MVCAPVRRDNPRTLALGLLFKTSLAKEMVSFSKVLYCETLPVLAEKNGYLVMAPGGYDGRTE